MYVWSVVGTLDTIHLKFREIHLKVAGKHKIFAILREAIRQPLVMVAGRSITHVDLWDS